MKKKILKLVIFSLFIMIIGGLGGILADHYVFPHLSATKFFSKYDFFKKFTEDVTVINKTEQIYVKEETSLGKISGQAASSVVNIASFSDAESGGAAKKSLAPVEPKNGTGAIVTSDGLIMTYVAAINPEKSRYKVTTADGNIYDGELLGTDVYSNLSFLKINANNLPAISFGGSADSKPGEKVIAIGNNLGNYSNRYAAGLLSSFNPTYNLAGKVLSYSDKLEGVFETDFNSETNYVGGPIIDYSGQVIGITGMLEKNGLDEYFQIPSNKVKKVIDRAIKKELDQNPLVGVYYVPITKTYAMEKNLTADQGALIFSPSGQGSLAIIAGSAGQKAGLQINDIIIAVNGQEINEENTFPDLLYQYKKGDAVELTILRNGQEIKLPVNL